jgi:hypothetical protein
VYLGDGSPDGGSGLLVALAEVVMRLLGELLGAEEVFRSGHWVLQLCTGPSRLDTARAHPANFVCLPGLTFLGIRRRMGEVIEPASTPG